MKKILILASNPRKDLRLDREIRDLKDVIEKSRNLQQLEVVDELAVRVGNLQEHLFRHKPQIVHFCGHGGGAEGLVFEGSEGEEQWVGAEALSGLFKLFPDVNCVLLNACYSEEQANAIVTHIDYVIGMSQTIRDDAAIAFSKGFYRALGYDFSIEQSYEVGCNAIQLEISGSSKRSTSTRSPVPEQQRRAEVVNVIATTSLEEHQKPILKKKAALSGASGSIPPETLPEALVAIQVEVDKALEEEDSSQKQYRDRVREFLSDRRNLGEFETTRLGQISRDLGLTKEEANQIQAEELEPILRSQNDYREILSRLIESGHYPFDAQNAAKLQKLRQELNLTDEEVEEISQPIFEAETARQEALRQQQQPPPEADRQAEADRRRREAEQPLSTPTRSFYSSPALPSASPTPTASSWSRRRVIRTAGLAALGVAGTGIVVTGGQLLQQRQPSSAPTARAKGFAEDLGNGVKLEMVQILGGKFLMGSPENEEGRDTDESPQHEVSVPPFAMGKFEVTQDQWKAIASLPKIKIDLNPEPSNFKGGNRPVETVSWNDVFEFCERLSRKTKKPYRLPSEAEWEYACRAEKTTPFNVGATLSTDLANYKGSYGTGVKGEYRKQTIAVGSFPPNAFGLYDMHGNVWEWCADYYHNTYQDAPADGSAWEKDGDSQQMMRGGSWDYDSSSCRSARRGRNTPTHSYYNLGFRVCLPFREDLT